ncbi:LysE family translocator [Pseudomonadales bacterium]|jgi:threonine/homoserine/homoserine lactone efflux protein|nr:LysE family translocator [Pseudomonadales bacterium]
MTLYLAILLFAFAATITPGPNNIMIMASGLNYGFRRSLPHLLGICLGFPAMVIMVGMGMGLIFDQYPITHQVIKILGILYLIYLSWLIATAPVSSLEAKAGQPLTFFSAVLFQWVNPKAWVMITGAMAAYTTADENLTLQILTITSAFLLVTFPCVAVWLFFGVSLKRFLSNDLYHKVFNIVMALLLLLSIAPIVLELIQHLTQY